MATKFGSDVIFTTLLTVSSFRLSPPLVSSESELRTYLMDAAWRQMTRPFCLWYVFLPQRCTHLPQVEIFFLVPFLGSSLEYFVAPFPPLAFPPSLPLFLLLYANFLKPVPHAIFRKAAGAAARIKK